MHRIRIGALLGGLLVAASSHAGDDCRQLSFVGEVKNGRPFEQPIGMGLAFRMQPSGEKNAGWRFEIGRPDAGAADWNLYIYALTPPWRGRHPTMIDTSYATPAQDAVAGAPQEFWFLASKDAAPAAAAALDDILWPKAELAPDRALGVLGALPKGSGSVEIVDASVVPGTAVAGSTDGGDFGQIRWLVFKVSLLLPPAFVPASGLATRAAPCPDTGAWARQLQP